MLITWSSHLISFDTIKKSITLQISLTKANIKYLKYIKIDRIIKSYKKWAPKYITYIIIMLNWIKRSKEYNSWDQ